MCERGGIQSGQSFLDGVSMNGESARAWWVGPLNLALPSCFFAGRAPREASHLLVAKKKGALYTPSVFVWARGTPRPSTAGRGKKSLHGLPDSRFALSFR